VNDYRPHPETERLAEYADGLLTVADRDDVERHLVGCADCREVLVETMAHAPADAISVARGRSTSAHVLPFQRRRIVNTLAMVVALAAVVVVAVRLAPPAWIQLRVGGDRAQLDELIAAVSIEPTRPVEGRLTGFRYAPPPSPVRGSQDHSPAVRIAAAEIEKRAEQTTTPESQAALGVALLVIGAYERGVAALENAAADRPTDAVILSDLSAGYLASAAQFGRADDNIRALSAADRSLQISNSPVEARFNRALALEALHRPEAADAWRAFLRFSSGTSNWTAEAQQHLDRATGTDRSGNGSISPATKGK
jgi:hypothetical protein